MSLDPKYIPLTYLQEYFVDRDTGAPLSGGFVSFYEDDSRTTSKNVYQLTGAPPNYTYSLLPNPITLSSVGVPVNADGDQVNIYAYPYDEDGNIQLYYVTVQSSLLVDQCTFQAVPNITAEDNPAEQQNNVQNQMSNSQFVEVLFDTEDGQVITFDEALSLAAYPVAPDWDIVISSTGAGTVTINRLPIEGALGITTNPPYILTILPSGSTISRMYLRQRLNHNPNIFASTTDNVTFLSGTMLIGSLDGLPHTLQMQYTQSNGSNTQTIVTGTTLSSGYTLVQNTVQMNPGTNTDNSDVGYVDIIINLPIVGFVGISSVQIAQLDGDQAQVDYEQETVNRQIDHLFHYYNPLLQFKPIPSYLVGWDFPLNPAQFGESGTMGAIGANTSKYVWDQTILFQSTTNSLSYSRFGNGGLEIAPSSTTKFAVIQYLTIPEIKEIFNNQLSVNVNMGRCGSGDIVGTISLWYCTDDSLPSISGNQSIVASLDSSGYPVSQNGTWVEITRSNLGNAEFNVQNSTDFEWFDYSFSGWEVDDLNDAMNNGNFFAIVVGFSGATNGNSFGFESISLVPGQIATRPAPKTYDSVLSECEYYYEKSYSNEVVPGAVDLTGAIVCPQTLNLVQSAGNAFGYIATFEFFFKSTKLVVPTLYIYSPSTLNAVGNVAFEIIAAGTSPSPVSGSNPTNVAIEGHWNFYQRSVDSTAYFSGNSSPIMEIIGIANSAECNITFQYVADARLGTF